MKKKCKVCCKFVEVEDAFKDKPITCFRCKRWLDKKKRQESISWITKFNQRRIR